MILSILAGFLIAKLKKHNLSLAFRDLTLFPLFLVELLYWFFQINTFLGNYRYIQYAGYLKNAFLLVLLLPILVHHLYLPSIAGAGLVLAGTVMNKVTIAVNGGHMPVFPTISKWTGYYNEKVIGTGSDSVHILGSAATKLKLFTDYIDIGWSILSLGDLFIHSFIAIIVFYTIKMLNQKPQTMLT